MSESWPPLDTHAHIEPEIDPTELLALRAAIFAATRTLEEFETTRGRADPITVWGVGVHPKVPAAFETFSIESFERSISRSPLVSEVGLDRSSSVPMSTQAHVLAQILRALRGRPRIVSMHSVGATAEVLDLIEEHAPVGVVLHWWKGTETQTARAVELGCRFSINRADLRHPAVIGRVPADRILTETDYPHGSGRRAAPGDVETIEEALAEHDRSTRGQVRRTI
ncbi:MAG: TatD family hydrolase, partial [Chloroflexi bacterium]|nr:TatD family hydrolase [Chloroflexota bacterium]